MLNHVRILMLGFSLLALSITFFGCRGALKEEASSLKRRMGKIEEGAGARSFPRERNKRTYHQIQGKLWQQGMSEDWLALSRRLADLREEWKKMNQERMDAAEERMRLLGHTQ